MSRALINLLNANRGRGFVKIVDGDPDLTDGDGNNDSAAIVNNTSTVYVYDAIGAYDGVEAAGMVNAIAMIRKSNIHVRINSPGGDVFDARAIKTALEQHPAKVTAFVDGIAASAASFLMLAADNIQIAPGAFVMIHNPWGFAMGDAREMRATAALLDQVGAAIRNDYSQRTGLDANTIAKMMDDETWMDADTALAKGFCNSLMSKPAKTQNAIKNHFNLAAYANAPKAIKEQREAFALLEAERDKYLERLNALTATR